MNSTNANLDFAECFWFHYVVSLARCRCLRCAVTSSDWAGSTCVNPFCNHLEGRCLACVGLAASATSVFERFAQEERSLHSLLRTKRWTHFQSYSGSCSHLLHVWTLTAGSSSPPTCFESWEQIAFRPFGSFSGTWVCHYSTSSWLFDLLLWTPARPSSACCWFWLTTLTLSSAKSDFSSLFLEYFWLKLERINFYSRYWIRWFSVLLRIVDLWTFSHLKIVCFELKIGLGLSRGWPFRRVYLLWRCIWKQLSALNSKLDLFINLCIFLFWNFLQLALDFVSYASMLLGIRRHFLWLTSSPIDDFVISVTLFSPITSLPWRMTHHYFGF